MAYFVLSYGLRESLFAAAPARVVNTASAAHQSAKLDFEEPRHADFPALGLAREAGLTGGTLPAVFNAANEVAVDAFVEGRIRFPDIWRIVGETMHAHHTAPASSLAAVIEADAWARRTAAAMA